MRHLAIVSLVFPACLLTFAPASAQEFDIPLRINMGGAEVVDGVDVVDVLTTISVGASSASNVTFCVVSDCAPPQAVTTSIPTSVVRRIPVIIPPLPVPARSR